MATTRKTVSFRCDRAFFDRMVEASNNVQLSLSEWMRRALEEAAKLQLPGAVLNGWTEAVLEDDHRRRILCRQHQQAAGELDR